MTRDDLQRFAQRDWSAIAEAKERDWLRRRQGATYADLLRRVDELRRHVRGVAPDGPSDAERREDADVHRRVGNALRAITDATR